MALLLIDAQDGVTAQDAHVAGYVLEKMKGVVVVVNKWDAVEKDTHTMHEFTQRIRNELKFLDYVPVLFISAKTKQRVSAGVAHGAAGRGGARLSAGNERTEPGHPCRI